VIPEGVREKGIFSFLFPLCKQNILCNGIPSELHTVSCYIHSSLMQTTGKCIKAVSH
jgi:hypothetical protein